MSTASDARFWDKNARRYSEGIISDRAGYERTLQRTRGLLASDSRVLELGCGTGTTALQLAGDTKVYLATDISPEMIAIAERKLIASPTPGLVFRAATVDDLSVERGQIDIVLGFNYLHLVRDLPGTLGHIHSLLASGGVFISKTPCLGNMNPLIGIVLLPLMRTFGKAPHANIVSRSELSQVIKDAGFDILAVEDHASRGNDHRPFIVARKL